MLGNFHRCAKRFVGCNALLLTAALATAPQVSAADTKADSETFAGLKARAIGPATTGGRIAAMDAVQTDRLTIYVGSAGGGVWKSADGGLTFKPVFEQQPQSIGAVTIDPASPNTVWVGTGESWVRNSVSVGAGIYKTTDGGENWQLMGLADTEHISRIVVNPKKTDTVYVCALGHLWNANAERGVFRTTDGGKTWKKVLYVNEDTGCSDISADPQDPQILYAGMWQARRYPWKFISGGPGSGLYKSTDGGDTWKPARKGLPAGDLGRVAVVPSPARASVVYAVVEAKKTALYRSDDLGETWTEMNSSFNIQGRPFYFAYLVADPKEYQRIYKPGYFLTVSDDGGKTFSGVGGGDGGGGYHGDLHALWIHPRDTNHLLLGTDGGVYASSDRGAHWRMLAALPVSQFYHVAYDMEQPYNVYGGLQDNGTWTGPSRHSQGIANRHWKNIGAGDGFAAQVDAGDADYVYVEYQGGHLMRVRRSTGESKQIAPFPREGEVDLRFNWNTPVLTRPSRGGTLYAGAQYLFRSTDRGDSWTRISPDLTTDYSAKQKQYESGGLTTDTTAAERHCTIFTISESPKNPEVVWVGTDDGNVQVTRDGGKTWSNVTKNLPGVPASTWVSGIEASHFEEGTAYTTLDGHQSGDMRSYVFRTKDFGKTWQALATADLHGYAHVIREDLVKPNLLFLGTESGAFVSIDAGASWAQLTGGMPSVAVQDMAIHPREGDLIMATHGRGIYILDDLTPVRNLTPEILDSDAKVLPSRTAVLSVAEREQRFDGDAEFVGASSGDSAYVAYYLKKRQLVGELRVEVYDAKGTVITSLPAGKRRGINRVEWGMRFKGPRIPPAISLVPDFFTFLGPMLPEGAYTVKLVKGSETYTGELRLAPDLRTRHSAADRALQYKTATELFRTVERLTYAADATSGLRDQAGDRAGKLAESDALRKKLEALRASLEELRTKLVTSKEGGYTGEIKLREKILALYGAVNGYAGRPTESQIQQSAVLGRELSQRLSDFESITGKELPALNAELEKNKLAPLKPLSLEEWQKKDEKKK